MLGVLVFIVTSLSAQCTSQPNLSVDLNVSYSFNVAVNGSNATWNYSPPQGFSAVINVNGTNTAPLKSGIPTTNGTTGVTAALNVVQTDCNTINVEYTITNGGQNVQLVGACLYADNNLSSDSQAFSGIAGGYGIYANNNPFYIRSQEAFHGIVSTGFSSVSGQCQASVVNITSGTGTDGYTLNWHGVSLNPGEQRVFQLVFSNYLSQCESPSGTCASCADNENQCYGKNSYCFWNSATCSNSSGNPTCTSSSACINCLSSYDCANIGSNCVWEGNACSASSCVSTCSSCPNSVSCLGFDDVCYFSNGTCYNSSCSGTTCSTCASSISCAGLAGCYFANGTCYNSSQNPSCSGAACVPCASSSECTNSSVRTCTWNSTTSTCSFDTATCTSQPYLSINSNASFSFNVAVNGSNVTYNYNPAQGVGAVVNVNGTNTATLKSGIPITNSATGVTATLNVVQADCNTINVEYTITNGGPNMQVVGACLYADQNLTGDSQTYNGIEGGYGMYAVGNPFYIRSQEAFHGIVSIGYSSIATQCQSSVVNITTNTPTDGWTLNWHGVSLNPGQQRVFQLAISNYISPCAYPSSGCSNCSANVNECVGKSEYCYYNSTTSTCSNSSGNPTCTSPPCTNCLSSYDCEALDGCSFGNGTCYNASCTGTTCSTCAYAAGCIELDLNCYFENGACYNSSCAGTTCSSCASSTSCAGLAGCYYANGTCYNISENPSCEGTECMPCITSTECTNTTARTCTWNSSSSTCEFNSATCTSTPRMTWTNATNSYMILLNGAKTTYSATAGWVANATVNGTSTGLLKPNTPVTTNGVITTLTVVSEDCNTVLVQWTMVNPTAVAKTVGACVYADAFILADTDSWTLFPDHTGLNVNGPFYIIASTPLNGIVSAAGCTTNGYTLTSYDTMSFNWNSVALPAYETKVFQVRYSNYMIGCSSPSTGCSDCSANANECYAKNSVCYYNSSSSTCLNSSGSPTCSSSACSDCLSYYDCNTVGSNCEWDNSTRICSGSSCTGDACSTCSTEVGCVSKSGCAYLNSTCLNISENPTCTGNNCPACATSVECTDSSVRSCAWNSASAACSCSGLPRMQAGTGTYSYSYQIYLNGTKTTYSESVGWGANVSIGGATIGNIKPNTPQTSSDVTATMTLTNVDCNRVLVEWELVNNGETTQTVGVCVWADSFIIVDGDAWTMFSDYTGFNVNGPFYVIASEQFSGIHAAYSCASGYNLATQDTMSFNWNGFNLPGGQTKIFSVTYSNFLIGCSTAGAQCQNCSDSPDQCFGKSDVCYYNSSSSSCSNSSGSPTCGSTSSCTNCLSQYDCVTVGTNCEWDAASYTCSVIPTCVPWDPCSQCETTLDCVTAGCIWDSTCVALNCEQYTVEGNCPTTATSTCGSDNQCSWSNSVCVDNGCAHNNTDCLYSIQSSCLDQPNCAWNPVLSICYYDGPGSSSNCLSTNTDCSACSSSRLCHGKDNLCYYSASACSNSTVTPSCDTTEACASCLAQAECEANVNPCKWNTTTMTCSIYVCTDTDSPCSVCSAGPSECYGRDSRCYYDSSNGVCLNSSLNTTCPYNGVCTTCLSELECTSSSAPFGCTWNDSTFTCTSPPCESRVPYYVGSVCWVNPQEQCYRNGSSTCVPDCGAFANPTNLTVNGSCAYVQTNCYSRIAEDIAGNTTLKTCGGDIPCYYFPDYASYQPSNNSYPQCNTTCPTNYQTSSEVINGLTRYFCVPKPCIERTPNPNCLLPGESGADCILNNGVCSTECPQFTTFQNGDCVPVTCSDRIANTTSFTCGSDSCYYINDGVGDATCADSCPPNYNELSEYINGSNRYYCTPKGCDERVPSPNCVLPGDVQTCYSYSAESKCYSTCPTPMTIASQSTQSCDTVQCASRTPVTADGSQFCGNDSCYYLPEAEAHGTTPCIGSCPVNYIPEQQDIFTGSVDTIRYYCAAIGSCEARTPANGNNCSLPSDSTGSCYGYNGSCYVTCPPLTVGGLVGGIPTCTLIPCAERQSVVDIHCRIHLDDACYLKGTQCTQQCGAFANVTAVQTTGICTYSPCAGREPQGAAGSETCGGSSVPNVDPPCYYYYDPASGTSSCNTSCPQNYTSEQDTLADGADRYFCQTTARCEDRLPTNNNCSITTDGTNYCYSYGGVCINSCPAHTEPTLNPTYSCSVKACEDRTPSGESGPCQIGLTDECYLSTSGSSSSCVAICPPSYVANDAGVCVVVDTILVGVQESIAEALEKFGVDINNHGLIDIHISQASFDLGSINSSNLRIIFNESSSHSTTIITTGIEDYGAILWNDKISSISNTILTIPNTLPGSGSIIYSIGSSYTATSVTIESNTSAITYTVILVEGVGELTLVDLTLKNLKNSADLPIIYSTSSGPFILRDSAVTDSASGGSVIAVNQTSSLNVSLQNVNITGASENSPSISINLLGTESSSSSSLVGLNNVNIISNSRSSSTSSSSSLSAEHNSLRKRTRTRTRNGALQCSWTTGVLVLTNVTANIGQSLFSGLTEGTLKVSGGNLSINGAVFTDALQNGTGYDSGSKIGTCSGNGIISITNSYIGGTTNTANVTTPLWISTPDAPTSTCRVTVNNVNQTKTLFPPEITNAQVDETAKTITLNGTNLYSCTEAGVVEYVVYEWTSGVEPTYEVLAGVYDQNTNSSTFVSSYKMILEGGGGGSEKRVGIRYFKDDNVTDFVKLNVSSEPPPPPPPPEEEDNSPSAKSKSNAGAIVGGVVGAVVVVGVGTTIAGVLIRKKMKDAAKLKSKADWIRSEKRSDGGGVSDKAPPPHDGHVKGPKKTRSPVRAEPKKDEAEDEEVEEEVEEEIEGEGEVDVDEEVEEEMEEEMEVEDDGSSEDFKSTANLL